MSKQKTSTLAVRGTAVSILTGKDGDFISLTDMLKAKDGDFFISDWPATAIRWSSSASGNRFSTPILITANSPSLTSRIRQV
jgi:hypothetical protein